MWWEKMKPCSSSLKVRVVLRDCLNNLLWQQKYSNCLGLIEDKTKNKSPQTEALFIQKYHLMQHQKETVQVV